jgi:hypothetical protein
MPTSTTTAPAPPSVEWLGGRLAGFAGPNRFACVLHGLFSAEECQALIDRSERAGYEAALVNTGGGSQQLMTDIRNNERCILDDAGLAELIWQRVRAHHAAAADEEGEARLLTAPWTKRKVRAVGLNERLRFLKYDRGAYFASHYDGCYVRGQAATGGDDMRWGETSHVTCQLYLNEGFEGGATRFVDERDERNGVDVVPKTGSVLLFEHQICHEGAMLLSGTKYAIRTDVMFTSKAEGEGGALDYAVRPMAVAGPSRSAAASASASELAEVRRELISEFAQGEGSVMQSGRSTAVSAGASELADERRGGGGGAGCNAAARDEGLQQGQMAERQAALVGAIFNLKAARASGARRCA